MEVPNFIAIFLTYVVVLVSGIDYICPYTVCQCDVGGIDCGGIELDKLPPFRAVNLTKSLSLFINDNSLTWIPGASLPPGLSAIDFQRNPITTIDQDAFDGSAGTLTKLLFSNARFTELPDAFLRLNNLTHLEISDTQIKTWKDDVIKHIGTILQTLILSNVGLIAWPTWIQYLPHLGTLELSRASMLIPNSGLDSQINTLFSLNLENGILQEIPSAVSKLTHLQTLVLDNNNISRVTGILSSPVLSALSMARNKIADAVHVSQALLSVAGSLTNLQLSYNLLTTLPDLSAMAKLDSLYLSYNAISHTNNSKIPPSLKYLDLEQNSLQSLESFMRNGFNLKTLKIEINSIRDIKGVDIPASVEDMDITFNLLEELTDESFPPNSNIQNLYLNNNPITRVSPKAFAGLTKLTYLSMSFTRLTRLPLSLVYLTSAGVINVTENNDLICTCMEKDVFSWLSLHKVIIEGDCGATSIGHFIHAMSGQCPD